MAKGRSYFGRVPPIGCCFSTAPASSCRCWYFLSTLRSASSSTIPSHLNLRLTRMERMKLELGFDNARWYINSLSTPLSIKGVEVQWLRVRFQAMAATAGRMLTTCEAFHVSSTTLGMPAQSIPVAMLKVSDKSTPWHRRVSDVMPFSISGTTSTRCALTHGCWSSEVVRCASWTSFRPTTSDQMLCRARLPLLQWMTPVVSISHLPAKQSPRSLLLPPSTPS